MTPKDASSRTRVTATGSLAQKLPLRSRLKFIPHSVPFVTRQSAMMKEPAGNRIKFPKLGKLARPSEGSGMLSWEYVQAISFLLARCANIAESLSIEHPGNRRSKSLTSRLQSFLGSSPSTSIQTVEGADAQAPEPADVSERLLALCNELVDGGNELGEAILKRRSTSGWQAGRFWCTYFRIPTREESSR